MVIWIRALLNLHLVVRWFLLALKEHLMTVFADQPQIPAMGPVPVMSKDPLAAPRAVISSRCKPVLLKAMSAGRWNSGILRE